MTGLEALLDYRPKGVSMAQHVTGWMDNIRKLKEWGIPLTEMPVLESMLFLRTLPSRYSSFIDNKKLQSEKLDDCTKLYEAAVAWSSTADEGADEANTTGKAMFGGGEEPGSKRTKRMDCFHCHKNGHYKAECPERQGLECSRCGRKGHTTPDCYSATRADGSFFNSSTKGAGGRGRGRGRGKGRDRGGKGRDRGGGRAFAMQGTQQSSKQQLDDAYNAGRSAAALDQANARITQMEAKAKEIGMASSFGCATPAVGALDDAEDVVGEALECLSLRDTVVLKADSGADDHYVNGDTPLHGAAAFNRQVYTAAGSDSTLSVTEEGMLAGTAQSTSGGVGIEIQAKKSEDFRYNLFSVRQAVRAGHAVVFAPGGSYIETADGTRIPLRCTRSGWELHVTGCGGGGGEGYAFDAETGETFTQPERRSSL
jgi:hypothetical protein